MYCPYPVYSDSVSSWVYILNVQQFLCGVAATFFTAVAVWHCPYPVYSACCVVLSFASIFCTAVAVWHCPFPVYSAYWFCFYLMYSGCCVALPLSCSHGFLRGIAPIQFTAVAVSHCLSVYSGCCVALPLSCLQRLLCGIAPILFTAGAVWLCFYPMYSGCRVALPVPCKHCKQDRDNATQPPLYRDRSKTTQQLLCGIAPVLSTALLLCGGVDRSSGARWNGNRQLAASRAFL